MDDAIWVLLGIGLIVFAIAGPLLGFVAFFRLRALRTEFDTLRRSFDRLQLASLDMPPPAPMPADVENADSEVPAEALETGAVDEPVEANSKVQKNVPTGDQSDPATDSTPVPEPAIAASVEQGSQTVSEPVAKAMGLEQTMGGKWAVWVGGITLALGAVFLVRYSIQQELLSPQARLVFGAILSLGLLGLGEWTRRRGNFFSVPGYERANIPATLTAAGTIGLFAAAYVAYAVYGFIGPTLAFMIMGAVALGTMVAALLHGPALAGLGLAGAYAAPFLVSTTDPKPWTLALYILFVSASALAVARWRMWRWLAIIAGIGLIGFAAVLVMISHPLSRITLELYLLLAFAMVAYTFVVSIYMDPANWPEDWEQTGKVKTDRIATALLIPLMLASLLLMSYGPVALPEFIETVATLIIGLGLVWYFPQVRYLALATVFVVVVRYLGFDVPFSQAGGIVEGFGTDGPGNVTFLLSVQNVNTFLAAGLILALYALGIGYRAATGSLSRVMLAICGTLLPVLLLIITWMRVDSFARSWVFFGVALALLGAFVFVARTLIGREDSDDADSVADSRMWPATIFITGAFATLALAVTIILEKGFLTIALALIVPAVAYVHARRPMPGLKQLALALMAVWALRVAWDPAIVGVELGTTPVFNWLLYGWGLSSLAFAAASWQFAKAERDLWLDITEGVTIAALTITVSLLATHAWSPQELFTPVDTLGEAGLMVLTGSGVALGLLWARRNSGRSVNLAIDVLGYGGMVVALTLVVIVYNPMLTGEPVGDNWVFNVLTLAYPVPAIVYGLIAWIARQKRSGFYPMAATGTAGLLAFVWISLVIRHSFHDGSLDTGPTSNAELYTYSIVWLAMGVVLLAVGLLRSNPVLRKASAGLIVLVILKAFLIDMASLEGIWRALSFIGLGAVLVGVGLFYQRLLVRQQAEEAAQQAEAESEKSTDD